MFVVTLLLERPPRRPTLLRIGPVQRRLHRRHCPRGLSRRRHKPAQRIQSGVLFAR